MDKGIDADVDGKCFLYQLVTGVAGVAGLVMLFMLKWSIAGSIFGAFSLWFVLCCIFFPSPD